MAAVLFLIFSGSSSGASDIPSSLAAPSPSQARELTAAPRVAPVCPAVQRAARFYWRRYVTWTLKMGAPPSKSPPRLGRCPHYLTHVLQRKARAARHAYERWSHEWEWQRWLPAKFYRVARCETGVDWRFDSGTYVSAFGIIRVAFPHWNGHNSPREQYEVASSIQRRYGWSAWGCGGA